MKRPALFLDRDGIINQDLGDYTFRIEDILLNQGLIEGLRPIASAQIPIIVITNQGGIAKGLYTLEDVDRVHDHIDALLNPEGIQFLEYFVDTHHDVIGESLSRKPGGLMLERAIYKHSIDPSASLMLGDKVTDVLAAESVGVKGLQVPANSDLRELKLISHFP